MSVRIIADSGCDIVEDSTGHLTVLPLSVAFGSTVYRDGVDLSHKRFYELLVEDDGLPTTGQVTPAHFLEAICSAWSTGEDVVIVALSSKLSGTYNAACTAAEEARALPSARNVFVVDSLNATVGQRVLVERALQLVDQGATAAHIASELEELRPRVRLVALLDTLEYLRRGGRISAAAAGVGNLLSFKPVISVVDGAVDVLGKARGSRNGRNLLTQKVEESGGIDFSLPICLGYSGISDALIKKYIEDSRSLWVDYPHKKLPVHTVGATIGTHAGPGAIALAFFSQA